jgi:hypothetical protein
MRMDEHAGHTQTSASGQEPDAAEALYLLQQQFGALCAYCLHFVNAKVDQLKMSGRHIVLWLLMGCMGAIGLITMIMVAVVLLLTGLATGLGVALGGTPWLGQVIVGLGLLILFAVGTLLGCRRVHSRARAEKVQDYAERQLRQRAQFGHSVADRAHGTTV